VPRRPELTDADWRPHVGATTGGARSRCLTLAARRMRPTAARRRGVVGDGASRRETVLLFLLFLKDREALATLDRGQTSVCFGPRDLGVVSIKIVIGTKNRATPARQGVGDPAVRKENSPSPGQLRQTTMSRGTGGASSAQGAKQKKSRRRRALLTTRAGDRVYGID